MPVIQCPAAVCRFGIDGGRWQSPDLGEANATIQVQLHVQTSHPAAAPHAAPAQLKPEKLEKPKLRHKDGQVEEPQWDFFKHQWNVYKTQANLTTNVKPVSYTHLTLPTKRIV